MRSIPFRVSPVSALLMALLGGCASGPQSAFTLSPEAPREREAQTRRFEGVTDAAMMSACVGVLQDIGFTLEGSESRLGVITASRKLTSRRPLNGKEIVKDLAWTALIPYLAVYAVYDAATGVKEPQIVRVSLVARAIDDGVRKGLQVRVTAQRFVYKKEDFAKLVIIEPLNDPRFYQEFFNRLEQSVFLEEKKT